MDLIANVAGFAGAGLFILAYLLLSIDIIKPLILYQILNMLGAVLLIVSLLIKVNVSALFLEASWFAISLYALIKLLLKQKK